MRHWMRQCLNNWLIGQSNCEYVGCFHLLWKGQTAQKCEYKAKQFLNELSVYLHHQFNFFHKAASASKQPALSKFQGCRSSLRDATQFSAHPIAKETGQLLHRVYCYCQIIVTNTGRITLYNCIPKRPLHLMKWNGAAFQDHPFLNFLQYE